MKKELVKNVILLFIVLSISFICIELALKFFMPQPCYSYPKGLYVQDKENCFDLAKNVNAKLTMPDYDIMIHTNSLGLRDYELSLEKYNILALGDSMQFGLGVDINDSYPKLIEKYFKDAGIELNVVNAGIPGYGTKQELAFLKSKGLIFDPKIILISYSIPTDFIDNTKTTCNVEIKDGYLVEKGVPGYKIFLNKLNTYCLFKKAILNIPFLRSLVYNNFEQSVLDLFKPEYPVYLNESVAATEDIFHELHNFAKKNDIPIVLILIPHRIQVETDRWTEIASKRGYSGYDLLKPNNILSDIARNNNITVIDMLPYFHEEYIGGENLYFPTDNHINEKGHEIVAHVLYKRLDELYELYQ